MTRRFLLVNPWIVDRAAYNFWLRPLGLYALAEWLWERGGEPVMVDCLSPFTAPGKFPRRKLAPSQLPPNAPEGLCRYGITPEEFRERLLCAAPFDAALITSAISYWYPGALEAVREVRRAMPNTPVVVGGVYPTLWPAHAKAHSGADHILPGTLARVSKELSSILNLPENPVRPKKPWWELKLHDGANFGAVRTARGCPHSCTYCASSALSDGFQPRHASEIEAELSALWSLGVREVAFYDDALLVGARERLFPALQNLQKSGANLSFQTPNGLHANLLDRQTTQTMVALGFTGFRLALETVDEARARETGGKVTIGSLQNAVENLLAAGANPESVGVYLLMGLPGQTAEEVEEGIRFVKNLGARPYLAEYSPIPGTAEWEKLAGLVKIPSGLDPLWTNNSLYIGKFGGWDEAVVRRLKKSAAER